MPHESTIVFLGICPREMSAYVQDMYKNVHSSFIHNSQIQKPKCPSTGKIDNEIEVIQWNTIQ